VLDRGVLGNGFPGNGFAGDACLGDGFGGDGLGGFRGARSIGGDGVTAVGAVADRRDALPGRLAASFAQAGQVLEQRAVVDHGFPELLGARRVGAQVHGRAIALHRAAIVDGQGVHGGGPVVDGVATIAHYVPDQHVCGPHGLGRGVHEPFLDRGPVAAVAGLLLRRKVADIERTHATLPLGQLGVGLPLSAQLLNQAVVFRAELATQPRPPHLSRGHDYHRRHDDDSDDDSYNCSGRHYDLREVSERHSDSPRSTGLNGRGYVQGPVRLRRIAASALITASRSAGPKVASARSVSLSVSAAMTSSSERPRSVSTSRTSRRSPGWGSRRSRPAASIRVAALVTVGVASPSRRAISPGVCPSSAHSWRKMNCCPWCTPCREKAAAVAAARACLVAQNAVWKSGAGWSSACAGWSALIFSDMAAQA